MPLFRYQAISPGGIEVAGVVDAANENEAVARIRESCTVVTKLTRTGYTPKLPARPISEKTLSLVCGQFAIILRTGLPIVRTVRLVADKTANKALRRILLDVADGVSAGQGLAASFAEHSARLPVSFIETVRAGEDSGTLVQSFEQLSEYFEKTAKIKTKVRNALTYPALIGVAGLGVVYVIMTVLVPSLARMFSSLGSDMPLPTRIVIAVSNFLVNYGVFVVVGIAAALLAIFSWSTGERGKLFFANLKMSLPVFGKLQRMQLASQFAGTMSTMLASALPITRALTVTSRAVTNFAASAAVKDIASGVEEGRRISECMRTSGYFPDLLCEMVAVGESTGSLGSTLDTVGDYFDSEVLGMTDNLVSMLEPAITIIVAVFVAFLLLAVYMPMLSMYSAV